MAERDLRSDLLNTLLTSPHRDLAQTHGMHQTMIEADPRFYVHLASWYADRGHVRDHKEMFVAMLCLSKFEGHRDVGLAILADLPPYEVARVVDFVKGYEQKQRRRKEPRAQGRKREVEKIVKKQVGLFQNIPRSLRSEVGRYLKEREADHQRFDRTALTARKALKRLYAGLHIQPSARAQAVLFDDDPPPDSLAFAVKQIAKALTPADQARAIAAHRIPYRVASTIIKEMSPMVLAALIDVMTPQEVINSISSLKKRGALDNPGIKELIDAKIAAAKSDQRVSAYKAKVAAEAAGATDELAEALHEVTEAQVKSTGKITRPTALLIDKSGSMNVAIEVGRQLGALASAICEADLFVYAFDSVAYRVESQGKALADWEKALAGINAGGNTSCGVAIEWMRRQKQRVEQIVMVTDEGENTAPAFKDAYLAYAGELNVRPSVVFVKVGQATNTLERACTELGVAPQVFEFRGDYYALPNVVPLLTYPSLMEMVMEILNPVAVRIQGTICQITVPPEVESGWAILRSLSTGKGEFVRKATLLEVSRYLSLFPRVKLVLVEKEERKWLAFPAQSGDTRFRVKGPVAVFLPEEALERFESIEARFDGRLFWYEGRDTSRDPAIAAYLRGELLRQESDGLPPKPDDLHKPGLSREEREAYAWVLSRIAQARRSRVETHLAEAVAHAGAELHSFVERGDAYVVTYEVDGQQFTSTVRRNDFTILTAGICLSGQDELFDLTSLVGVLREGRSGLAP